MMWRSRIFFRALAALAAVIQAPAATVSGSVALVDSRNPSVRKHQAYSGVVVWLDPLDAAAKAAMPAPPAAQHATMIQKDKTFMPHILAVRTGTTVDFPNDDPIFHNAFSNYDGQLFDLSLYRPGSTKSVLFRREGIVRIFCNIHPSMSAVIVVVKTADFAVSNPMGAFQIRNVAPGTYTLKLFHERATQEILNALSRSVEVPPEGLTLPTIKVSESGYLPVAHRNKYGLEYPPDKAGAYTRP